MYMRLRVRVNSGCPNPHPNLFPCSVIMSGSLKLTQEITGGTEHRGEGNFFSSFEMGGNRVGTSFRGILAGASSGGFFASCYLSVYRSQPRFSPSNVPVHPHLSRLRFCPYVYLGSLTRTVSPFHPLSCRAPATLRLRGLPEDLHLGLHPHLLLLRHRGSTGGERATGRGGGQADDERAGVCRDAIIIDFRSSDVMHT